LSTHNDNILRSTSLSSTPELTTLDKSTADRPRHTTNDSTIPSLTTDTTDTSRHGHNLVIHLGASEACDIPICCNIVERNRFGSTDFNFSINHSLMHSTTPPMTDPLTVRTWPCTSTRAFPTSTDQAALQAWGP
ncbi:14602_t:CDS:2, partial [Acaulospora colombiana]